MDVPPRPLLSTVESCANGNTSLRASEQTFASHQFVRQEWVRVFRNPWKPVVVVEKELEQAGIDDDSFDMYAVAQIMSYGGVMIDRTLTLGVSRWIPTRTCVYLDNRIGERIMKIIEIIAAAMLASALAIPLAGCEDEGPLEEAGEEIDEGVEDAGDAIEDSTDGN